MQSVFSGINQRMQLQFWRWVEFFFIQLQFVGWEDSIRFEPEGNI